VGEPPCTLLQAEMALDLLEGELAAELPAHMRAFARAHAAGRPPPPAPLLARLPSSLKTARNALAHELLADRGVALLRLLVPLMIDVAVPAERSWDAYRTFAAAREALAQTQLARGAIELVHALGGGEPGEVTAIPPHVAGWQEAGAPLDDSAIVDAWQAIEARHGIAGNVRIDRGSAGVVPRTFVVVPRAEVIVVVPALIDTPRARTQVLHELGHAAAALILPAGIPRAVDEAAASYIARLAEPGSWLPARWTSELATDARARRRAIAGVLDAIERAPHELDRVLAVQRPGVLTAPPPALWDDPGAQASYVAAETIADRLVHDLGQNPPRGQLARALAAEHDRVTWRTCELGWR